jgi:hypothetical protein
MVKAKVELLEKLAWDPEGQGLEASLSWWALHPLGEDRAVSQGVGWGGMGTGTWRLEEPLGLTHRGTASYRERTVVDPSQHSAELGG